MIPGLPWRSGHHTWRWPRKNFQGSTLQNWNALVWVKSCFNLTHLQIRNSASAARFKADSTWGHGVMLDETQSMRWGNMKYKKQQDLQRIVNASNKNANRWLVCPPETETRNWWTWGIHCTPNLKGARFQKPTDVENSSRFGEWFWKYLKIV